AGYGKDTADTVRGIKQRMDDLAVWLDRLAPVGKAVGSALGMPSAEEARAATQADVDESKRLDAPLMADPIGRSGNFLAGVAKTVPAMAVPGLNTVAGSAALGGAMGFAKPTATGESVAAN